MSTAECREAIVDQWDRDGKPADWKRLSKKVVGDHVARLFENKNTKETIYYISQDDEDDDGQITPAGDVLYHVTDGEKIGEDGILVAFNPVSYWQKEKCLWDQHYGWVLANLYGVPEWITCDEVCENQFVVEETSLEKIEAALSAIPNLSRDPEFSKFLDEIAT